MRMHDGMRSQLTGKVIGKSTKSSPNIETFEESFVMDLHKIALHEVPGYDSRRLSESK